MKRGILFGYGFVLTIALSMQSCVGDPITVPTDPSDGIDTTWVNDSTDTGVGGDNPIDSTDIGGGDPSDSILFGG